jgi:hypothetical protein
MIVLFRAQSSAGACQGVVESRRKAEENVGKCGEDEKVVKGEKNHDQNTSLLSAGYFPDFNSNENIVPPLHRYSLEYPAAGRYGYAVEETETSDCWRPR